MLQSDWLMLYTEQNFFTGGLLTLGLRRTAGQKAVGPTLAANVRPTDVPTLGQHCPNVGMLSGPVFTKDLSQGLGLKLRFLSQMSAQNLLRLLS